MADQKEMKKRLKVLMQKQQFEQSLTNQISKKIQTLQASEKNKKQDHSRFCSLRRAQEKQERKNYEFVQEYKQYIEGNKAKSLEIHQKKKNFSNQLGKMQKDMNLYYKKKLDEKFIGQLSDATHVDRLNIGPIPTTRLNWLQPHEGNIIDFLFRSRAYQVSEERMPVAT